MKKHQTTQFSGYNELLTVSDGLTFSPNMCNFKILPDGSLKKREGYSELFTATGSVEGLWGGTIAGHNILAASIGGDLWIYDLDLSMSYNAGEIGTGHASMFPFGGKLYILNGVDYYCYDGNTLTTASGYAPLILIACDPSDGSGTLYEEVNLLSLQRRQRFNTDGSTRNFRFTEKNIDKVDWVKFNGETLASNAYSFSKTYGAITLTTAPAEATDALEVCYTLAATESRRSIITAYRYAMIFGGNTDNRIFIWGSEDEPCTIRHTALGDGVLNPEYFPENSFRVIGDTAITDIIQQYDRQLIFAQDRAFYSYCDLTTDAMGNAYASYPVFALNASKGSLIYGGGTIADGCPITFCGDGLNRWEATNVQDERSATCFSQRIDKSIAELLRYRRYEDGVLHFHQPTSELFLCCEDKMYICNTRLNAWYVYDGLYTTAMCTVGDSLYIGDRYGRVVCPNDSIKNFEATWVSPTCSFGCCGRLFTTGKLFYTAEWKSGAGFSVGWAENTLREGSTYTETGDGITDKHELYRAVRLPAKRVAAVKLQITSPSGKDACIHALAVEYNEMGDYRLG